MKLEKETLLVALAGLVFAFGVVMMLLGSAITFFPGAERGWFAFTGALLLAGLLVPRWPVRILAAALVAVCVSAVWL